MGNPLKMFKKSNHTIPTLTKTWGWIMFLYFAVSAWLYWAHPGRIIDTTLPDLTGDNKMWAYGLTY